MNMLFKAHVALGVKSRYVMISTRQKLPMYRVLHHQDFPLVLRLYWAGCICTSLTWLRWRSYKAVDPSRITNVALLHPNHHLPRQPRSDFRPVLTSPITQHSFRIYGPLHSPNMCMVAQCHVDPATFVRESGLAHRPASPPFSCPRSELAPNTI